jgi:hypothetical protein
VNGRYGSVVLEVRVELPDDVEIEDAARALLDVLLFAADQIGRYEVDTVVVLGQQSSPPSAGKLIYDRRRRT